MKRKHDFRPDLGKRPKRPPIRLSKPGVADRERFLRGCLAVFGALFLLLLFGLLYAAFFR